MGLVVEGKVKFKIVLGKWTAPLMSAKRMLKQWSVVLLHVKGLWITTVVMPGRQLSG